MIKEYCEDQLTRQSVADFLKKEQGWTSVYAFEKHK